MQVTLSNVVVGETIKAERGGGALNTGSEYEVVAVVKDATTARGENLDGLLVKPLDGSKINPYVWSETRFTKPSPAPSIWNTVPGTKLECTIANPAHRLNMGDEYEVVAVMERGSTARKYNNADGFFVKDSDGNVHPYLYSPGRFALQS